MSRLCNSKPLLTVNGQFPGPTIAVHEGDNVEVKVVNLIDSNTTIHWWVYTYYTYIKLLNIYENQSLYAKFRKYIHAKVKKKTVRVQNLDSLGVLL